MKALVGRRVRVFWDGDEKEYEGVILRANNRSRDPDNHRANGPPLPAAGRAHRI